jgi:hypothetical protein
MAGRQNLGPEQLAETCYAGLKEMLDKKRDFGLLGLMRASGMHVAQLMTFSNSAHQEHLKDPFARRYRGPEKEVRLKSR